MSNDALDRSITEPGAESRYTEVHQTPEFRGLRARFRKFVFTLTALFLAWYFLYVLLSTFASDFMSTKVAGTITIAYVRWADRQFDPAAEALREQIEGDLR